MNRRLIKRGQALEALFFRKQDAALIAQHERLEHKRRTREALAEVSGIQNPQVLDTLMQLDITPSIMASLAVVPLMEVAWADGLVQEKERETILASASECGICKKSVDYELLEAWLNHRPPKKLLAAWTHFISGLCETMTAPEREALRFELLSHAQAVAEAAGGFLGLTSKISAREQAILDEMSAAFK